MNEEKSTAGERSAVAHLQFATSILSRLGEELIPDPDQGLLELVRNAYDAGATRCTIDLLDADAPGGTILIEDDGAGMSVDDIAEGFLVLGKSRKQQRQHNRLMVGEKGLGRLAALRLGHHVTLETRPMNVPLQHTLDLDWDEFDTVGVVGDVDLRISTSPRESDSPSGTRITVRNLRQALPQKNQRSLVRSLLLLSDPFGSDLGFKARLVSDGFAEMERLVQTEYFGAAEFRLTAKVDPDGLATATIYDNAGKTLAHADHEQLRRGAAQRLGAALPYACPPARFELYVFLLGGRSESVNARLRQIGVVRVREWLRAVGGVHLYHRGLRVRPFGDPGYDWLGLDVRRAQSPEDRPSTNTVIGRISLDDADDALVPKTDRVGFVENEALQELRSFASDATEFLAGWRTERSARERQARRERERTAVDSASAQLARTVEDLPVAQRKPVAAALRAFTTAAQRRDEGRLDDIQLYRTMSTLGAATSVFAHESDKPTERLMSLLKLLRRRLGTDELARIRDPLDELDRVAVGLRALSQMPLRLLKSSRRRIAPSSVGASAAEIISTFDYFLRSNDIVVEQDFAEGDMVLAAQAALEVIVANMVVNAVSAFRSSRAASTRRLLSITTTVSSGSVLLEVSDNGPGLEGISSEQVWQLGETRREGGSGLGLAIVRDTVRDLGGTAEVQSPGTLGGATFFVKLPKVP